MLRSLLLRDLSLHRRVLLTASVLPVLFLVLVAAVPGPGAQGQAVIQWILGLLILAQLPHSLHLREGRLGTLGGLLVLPLRRRDVVRLRFLEGLLGCVAFTGIYFVGWILVQHLSWAALQDLATTSAPIWVLLVFLAYPAPFVFRWGGAGLAVALGLLFGSQLLWAFLVVYGRHFPYLGWVFRLEAWGRHLQVHGAPGTALAWATPLLLIYGFYRLSCWAIERVEA
ncbi:MAG TPA: hypothetical protein VF768_06180 [Holophagaceae bacterium]